MIIEDLPEYTGFEPAVLDSTAESIVSDLLRAVEAVRDEANSLLKIRASEQAIAHRVAFQLEVLLRHGAKPWDVDCEYNRVGNENDSDDRQQYLTKRLTSNGNTFDVNPDLVVHRRGTSDNELVVEMKVDGRSHSTRKTAGFDLKKLKLFHDDPRFRYREAVFILFYVGEAPRWDIHRYAPPGENSSTNV
ncbi:hypothetical protein CLV85_0140 [Salinibacterium amurskyense]|uniref:Uncharacterized protein n=1 Tax=Salinibacterium amurskyense TaxID=205941 RepID=A0A2M9D635_9MICO|nr:hypothetical protein [Salinibacterium amurskyense]PJJ80973.1 hypothetical protein CLV85_0140 [Salinibacterium amurskyense]RLQ83012.1 hypothetical protein D9C83_00700 [Salinibacterium amurskyense]GHD81916.1 hypothetical protein GCM10007394_16650 [Salinibacterium amurskyense]